VLDARDSLGGKSSRMAARSAKSPETLDLLLRDMENRGWG
jgi:hypothetical protein